MDNGKPRMDTMTEVIDEFRSKGYDQDWYAEDGALTGGSCGKHHAPAEMTVDHIARFEGESDPGDEQILFALTCPCGCKGLYTPAYGPYASEDDITVVQGLPSEDR